MSKEKLTVYYDGLCQLCSREIDHYRRSRGSDQIRFVDITSAEFNAEAEGLDPQRVHQVMHVRSADGQIHTEVDAFLQIWKVLPGYGWMSKLVSARAIRPLVNLGYKAFARIRPWLPRKKADCSESPYCETGLEAASAGPVGETRGEEAPADSLSEAEIEADSTSPFAEIRGEEAPAGSASEAQLEADSTSPHFKAKV